MTLPPSPPDFFFIIYVLFLKIGANAHGLLYALKTKKYISFIFLKDLARIICSF